MVPAQSVFLDSLPLTPNLKSTGSPCSLHSKVDCRRRRPPRRRRSRRSQRSGTIYARGWSGSRTIFFESGGAVNDRCRACRPASRGVGGLRCQWRTRNFVRTALLSPDFPQTRSTAPLLTSHRVSLRDLPLARVRVRSVMDAGRLLSNASCPGWAGSACGSRTHSFNGSAPVGVLGPGLRRRWPSGSTRSWPSPAAARR